MNFNPERLFERVVLGFICILLVALTYAVIDTASGYEKPVYEAEPYQYPTIPECDRELWLRIKDRCSGSHARPQAPPPAKDGDTGDVDTQD